MPEVSAHVAQRGNNKEPYCCLVPAPGRLALQEEALEAGQVAAVQHGEVGWWPSWHGGLRPCRPVSARDAATRLAKLQMIMVIVSIRGR